MTDFKKWAEGIAGGDRTKIAVTTAHILALRKCACFDSIRKLGGVLIELGAKAPPGAKAGAVGALAKALTSKKAWSWPTPRAKALANMSTPNPTTCARWRRGLLVLSDLVAATATAKSAF